jgi:hypothetical protein
VKIKLATKANLFYFQPNREQKIAKITSHQPNQLPALLKALIEDYVYFGKV